MPDPDPAEPTSWREAWPDAVGFAAGLALAWQFQWQTRDLVWSLWLSSLTVGYALIVWILFSPAWSAQRAGRSDAAATAVAAGVLLLAFFTFHFGMFHFVHSVFLNAFFPVHDGARAFPGPALYFEVAQRYWWFVPLALLAERQGFRPVAVAGEPPVAPQAARKAPGAGVLAAPGNLMRPYRNVIRLHLLIFFFAGAHFAKLDNFLVYAVVYAVYFFPWRLLRGPAAT